LKLERDYALAKSDFESLQEATLPLEVKELSLQLLEARSAYDLEAEILDDSVELAGEGLVSDQEVERQRIKVEQARIRLENIETVQKMTGDYLHPARLERSRATLDEAEQQLELARRQLERCRARAPAAGVVVYRPLHIGTEYRAVRVGDSIYKNQVFMVIPDMLDVVVRCHVPESELSRVGVGRNAVVSPVAYPDMQLEGSIESVGSMAQTLPGHAGRQKFFEVVIALDEVDALLRSGMSVQTSVLSYYSEQAVQIPRSAVWWDAERPHCHVQTWGGTRTQALRLGWANHAAYEVLEGLAPGDVTLLQ
jgi:multidrug efflux pump subunit AcrA (membrane-fusion protein)